MKIKLKKIDRQWNKTKMKQIKENILMTLF